MGIFDGLSSSFSAKSFVSNTVSQLTSNVTSQLQSTANSVVGEALSAALGGVSFSGGSGGLVNGKGGTTRDMAYAKTILQMAMQIQYAQGWQFVVEADGLSDLFMYVKDVTYGAGTVETESKIIGGVMFNKPTHISAGTVTLTVRDSQDGKIAKWFDARKARVINQDGTLNLPPFYTMAIRVYRIGFDGSKSIDREMKVFPTERGSTTRGYDQSGEFFSYPLTFVSYSSADTSLKGIATSAVVGAAGNALSSVGSSISSKVSSIIKF
ncbi:phage tail protein [Pantoea sp. LMR881]|uniref:phage tail protein n=1 Tax=Pantoea sp. LMR881 TaxID=3014336 RepID=UPI0022AF384A|nr:phage tail protein [Pantoea sp. LMR881]MCZ4061255.1 phage tail protein [Pantoea sp. LMR881]